MSIEQHHDHPPGPAEAGASLARLLDGLTLTMLDLPDAEPVTIPDPTPEPQAQAQAPQPVVPEPRVERRGNVLNELGFLDD